MSTSGGTAPRPAPRHLVVVDLSASAGPRRALRELVGRWLRWRARAAPTTLADTAVLVHAPAGDAQALALPPALRTIAAEDALSAADADAVHEWAFAASLEIVRGRGRALFPDVAGMSAGELNLAPIQIGLAQYGALAATIRALVGAETRRVTIVSANPAQAAALGRELRRDGVRVRVLAPPSATWVRRLAERALRRRAKAPSPVAAPDPASLPAASRPAAALILAESRAMGSMFDLVTPHLSRAGIAPMVRVDHVAKEATPGPGGEHVLRFPMPEQLVDANAVAEAGRAWAAVAGDAARLDLRAALGGTGYAPPLDAILEPIFRGRLAQQIAYAPVLARVLDAVAPRVVVVGNDRWWTGQMWVRLARARGAATVCVQDGAEGGVPNWWWMTADVMATSGERQRRQLVAHGTPPERAVVTGQPRYDRLYAPGAAERTVDARRRLSLDAEATHALFALQPRHDEWYQRAVIGAVLAHPGLHLVVRPHPAGPPVDYAALTPAGAEGRVRVERAASIYDLLDACDLLVTQYSTTVIEAAILGLPVISADFSGAHEITGFVSSGLARLARTPAEVQALVGEIAARGRRGTAGAAVPAPGAVREFNGPADGRAAERVAALVRDVAARA